MIRARCTNGSRCEVAPEYANADSAELAQHGQVVLPRAAHRPNDGQQVRGVDGQEPVGPEIRFGVPLGSQAAT
jgi:hypothetical protein